jgi:hypothetical protein
MTSSDILKYDAGVIKQTSGSTYVLLPVEMKKIIGLTDEDMEDLKIVVAESTRHGRFFYIFSPKNQRRNQREKLAELEKQAKLDGGEKQ